MKILVLAPYFYPKIGGLENYAWHSAQGLKQKYGWEIVVIAANHREKKYKEEILHGIKIYRFPYWFKLSNTPINFHWFSDINTIVTKEKPDIINAHTPVPFIADLGALVSYLKSIPFVLTYHNDLVKNNILDVCFKMYYGTVGKVVGKLSRSIIATSPYYADNSNYLKQYKHKLEIIPPGVDFDFITRIEPERHLREKYHNKFIVLFVGQLDRTHQHKGLSYLIESIKIIQKQIPNVQLLVIGKGDMVHEYKKMGEGIALEILENVENSILFQYYKIAETVVLPSISDAEGFGMTLIEAGACKKPVVGSRVGGIPYVIDPNKTGLLCNPKDTVDLANQLVKLLNNKDLSRKMGEAGFENVKNNFTLDRQIVKTHELFSSL